MFFSVRRYCPAHFHVWSNILLWRFRTYSSEGISAGLVRSSMAQALACRLFSRSHSLSSSFVAKLGMRSASSSGESGVLPSLPVPSWSFLSGFLQDASGFFLDLVLDSTDSLIF